METTIQLEGGTWEVQDVIGQGGFGRVNAAVGPDGRLGALKFIPKSPAAQRELLFADSDSLQGVPYVIPIVDRGETSDEWVLAMPRADRSLRDVLDRQQLQPDAALPVLSDVARALVALADRKIVHRDLKPENILLLGGKWCLTDFSISRYVGETTRPDTQRRAMTARYAAPEQWRLERPTSATDIYAFGVIAYEILAGERPFPGPTPDDLREQHLNANPPRLEGIDAGLAALVTDCLIKASEGRPPADAVLRRLQASTNTSCGDAAERLRQANLEVTERRAAAAADEMRAATEAERRAELLAAAEQTLKPILDELSEGILRNAPSAAPPDGATWPLRLNEATLCIVPFESAAGVNWEGFKPAFAVIASAGLELLIPQDHSGYVGRSCSLWYCDAVEAGGFRWYEVAFMIRPIVPRQTPADPVALRPGRDAGGAVSSIMDQWQLAWPFTPIDQGDGAEFIERWMGWFAHAAQGKLHHPKRMPERLPGSSFRLP